MCVALPYRGEHTFSIRWPMKASPLHSRVSLACTSRPPKSGEVGIWCRRGDGGLTEIDEKEASKPRQPRVTRNAGRASAHDQDEGAAAGGCPSAGEGANGRGADEASCGGTRSREDSATWQRMGTSHRIPSKARAVRRTSVASSLLPCQQGGRGEGGGRTPSGGGGRAALHIFYGGVVVCDLVGRVYV